MTPYQNILQLFSLFLSQDTELLTRLRAAPNATQSGFYLSQTEWHFRLPELHQLLRQQHPPFENMTYPQFRQLIFNNPFNHDLNRLNAEIIIIKNRHKVDLTVYAIRKKPTPPTNRRI